jgi:hypothetical protein
MLLLMDKVVSNDSVAKHVGEDDIFSAHDLQRESTKKLVFLREAFRHSGPVPPH